MGTIGTQTYVITAVEEALLMQGFFSGKPDATPSALARVHLTVRYLPYRTKKPPAFAEGLYIMVPGLGIEPRTRGFSILCSTN